MAIIQTERNHVYAYEVTERDCMVQTLIGPGTGEPYRVLLTQPIDQYQAAVDWAVKMADQFQHPVHVVPIDSDDHVTLNREALERRLAELSPDEVRALRKDVVTTCATVMRDCHDPAVRAEAYDVLASMKELR